MTLPQSAAALPRAAIYARVSTAEQAERGYSLDGQVDECLALAEREGCAVPPELVRKEVSSGADLNLPELLDLLNRAKNGEFDVLLCLATSRLSRDTVKAGVVKRELQRYGVPVRYVQHTFDPSPTGRLMEHIFEGLDQFEKENIALRFNLGKQRKARSGMVVGGGRVPYGNYSYAYRNGNSMNWRPCRCPA